MNIFKFLLKPLKSIYRIIDLKNRNYHNNLLISASKFGKNYFLKRKNEIIKNVSKDVENYERKTNFYIDREWLYDLALYTQIPSGKSFYCCEHGKVLYSSVSKWIKDHNEKSIKILETGTARGFSSLCMAKALSDSSREGIIVSIDVLPNDTPIFWNCITDIKGKLSRKQLLKKWEKLVNKYLIFIQNDTKVALSRLSMPRINIAFLDACHTYQDVIIESNYVSSRQEKGDIIIFDDYNNKYFKGVIKAVKEFSSSNNYELEIIKGLENRDYAIVKKI